MAAAVETAVYYREKAWHGLGTVVSTEINSADALHLAGLDWTVDSKPVFVDNKEIPGYIANVRSSDNKVLGIVGNRYKIVQNVDAFAFTDTLIGGDVKYESAGSLCGGSKIWLLAQMPTTTILGEDVEPYVCFTNTHDGTGSIRVCMTPIRVVCQNTLNLALSTASRNWATRHIGDIYGKLAEAKHTLGMANKYMEALGKEAEELVSIKVDDVMLNKMLNQLFAINREEDSERKIKNLEEMRNNFMVCYAAPDLANFKGTAYGIVQAAADYASHAQPARMTANFKENNWNKIIGGHPFLDNVYDYAINIA